MKDLIFTQLTLEELRKIFQEELDVFLSKIPSANSSSPSPSKELLTVEEASIYLNLARSTLYNLVHRKEIPYMKRSRKLYFSKDELRKWVEEARKPTQSDLDAAAQTHLSQLKKRS